MHRAGRHGQVRGMRGGARTTASLSSVQAAIAGHARPICRHDLPTSSTVAPKATGIRAPLTRRAACRPAAAAAPRGPSSSAASAAAAAAFCAAPLSAPQLRARGVPCRVQAQDTPERLEAAPALAGEDAAAFDWGQQSLKSWAIFGVLLTGVLGALYAVRRPPGIRSLARGGGPPPAGCWSAFPGRPEPWPAALPSCSHLHEAPRTGRGAARGPRLTRLECPSSVWGRHATRTGPMRPGLDPAICRLPRPSHPPPCPRPRSRPAQVWIQPGSGVGGSYLAAVESLTGGSPELTVVALLGIFAVAHSGLAGLRPYGARSHVCGRWPRGSTVQHRLRGVGRPPALKRPMPPPSRFTPRGHPAITPPSHRPLPPLSPQPRRSPGPAPTVSSSPSCPCLSPSCPLYTSSTTATTASPIGTSRASQACTPRCGWSALSASSSSTPPPSTFWRCGT
jgi:hypothetical protein